MHIFLYDDVKYPFLFFFFWNTHRHCARSKVEVGGGNSGLAGFWQVSEQWREWSPYITSSWSVADSRSKVPSQETKESSNASFTCDYIDTREAKRADGDKKLDLHRSDWNTQTMLLSIDRHFRVSEFYFGKAATETNIASRWAKQFN